MPDTTYRVWDEDGCDEEDGDDEPTDSPEDAARIYVEENHSDMDHANSVDVSVRNKTTDELTRWTVTVEYEPTFTARERAT